MMLHRHTGEVVVVSWSSCFGEGIESTIALQAELLRTFRRCTHLHFQAGKAKDRSCYIRLLVTEEQPAIELADHVLGVLKHHGVDGDARVEPAEETSA